MEKYGVMFKYKCKECGEEIVAPYYEEKSEELSKHASNEACPHSWEREDDDKRINDQES